MMKLSIVIPVYNGAATIQKVVDDCFVALAQLNFELILVNDGSADSSEDVIFALAKQHPNVKAISLSKNVGEFSAVMCGLGYSVGDYVAIIDDDGQNPPPEILKLLAEAEKGYDVVYAKYAEKKHSWWRNAGSWLNSLLATIFIGKPLGLYLSSFKVINRDTKNRVVALQSRGTYIDGLIFRKAVKYSVVMVEHKTNNQPSRYNILRLIGTFLSMVDSGVYKFYYFAVCVVLTPILLLWAGMLTFSEAKKDSMMLINTLYAALLTTTFLAVAILALLAFYAIKMVWIGSVLNNAKTSPNA